MIRRLVSYFVLLVAVAWLATLLRVPGPRAGELDTRAFGALPVLSGGRIKPLDTVARNSLLIIRGKQTLRRDGKSVEATRWLADVLFNPSAADGDEIFAVRNPELLGMLGLPLEAKRYCSYNELQPSIPKIEEEANLAAKAQASDRSPFQSAVFALRNSMALYQRLGDSVQPGGELGSGEAVRKYAALVAEGAKAMQSGGLPAADKAWLSAALSAYETQANRAELRPVVPPAGGKVDDWLTTGSALMRASADGSLPASVEAYADLGDALRAGDRAGFARIAQQYSTGVAAEHPQVSKRMAYEMLFNHLQPFYASMVLYVGVFFLACLSWVMWPKEMRNSAMLLLCLAFVVHTLGLIARMWLQGRPPVTNLYSSAIFVGWGAVLLALVIERIFRDGLGAACGGIIGFSTLIIAHHLGTNGDTMEMMQAVLDNNFWLATHVVVITIGYSAMFLAGILAVLYIVLGLGTRVLAGGTGAKLAGMVYGIVCFACLFSFVGTVLGGIWADQSWGRFWGWDPKENGAMLIVLWCALILHARWGGFIRHRGMMAMAVFGNVVTAFSWFGVNMLGVGLHSYGFMEKAFPWLLGFCLSQAVLIFLSRLPAASWRSFREAPRKDLAKAGFEV